MKKSEVLEILNQRFSGNNVVDYGVMEFAETEMNFLNVRVNRLTWEELDLLKDYILSIDPNNYASIDIIFTSDIEID